MRISDWSSDVCSSDLFENIIEETVGSSGSFAANTTKLETGAMTYQARFYSGSWRGDLLAYQVDVDSKQLVQPAQWSAGSLLDARPWAANATKGKRTIIRSEEHTSELQSLMRSSYAVFCLKTKKIAE